MRTDEVEGTAGQAEQPVVAPADGEHVELPADRPLVVVTARAGRVLVVAVGLALAAAPVVGVKNVLGLGLPTLAGAIAVAALLTGTWLYRRAPVGWTFESLEPTLLLAGGVAALTVGQGGLPVGGSTPSGMGWLLRLVALGGYPLLVLGLTRLLQARIPGRVVDVLVQASLVATLFAFGIWALAARTEAHVSSIASLTAIVFPALDLVLVVITIRLMMLPGERIFVYRGVALAAAYLLGAHVASAIGEIGGWDLSPALVRTLLVCSFGFWSLAALDASMQQLFDPIEDEPPAFSPGHFVMVQMGMLAAPAVLALHAGRQDAIPLTTAIGAAALSLVLSAYLGSLIWQRGHIEHRAHHDALTGLPNRTLFADRLARAVAHARRNDVPVAVMFVDLDRFKQVNDSFGHGAGDELLRQVARRLAGCVRDEDTVARLGGDEFALLLPHLSGLDGAITIADRVMAAFNRPVVIAEEHVVITPSVGISMYPVDGTTPEELIEGADAAMYRAKERGRNTYEIFSPELQTQAHERLALEAALHLALEREELVLHYQPKVDIRTGRITGAEALVRWNHPEKGLLFPGHFVPVAEQTGQVVALGELVLAQACEQLVQWQQEGLSGLSVSVNVSARQIRHGLVDFVAAVLRHTGIDPQLLELELTESAALESFDVTVRELDELRAMGIRCSIDDFGTGYSSLSYLSRLPIDCLKVDRSFIGAMSAADASIVAAIIALGHSLGLKIVAEGVETDQQLNYLSRLDCDEVQGFLFSKAVPADDFARLVREQPVEAETSPAVEGPSAGTEATAPAETDETPPELPSVEVAEDIVASVLRSAFGERVSSGPTAP